MGSIGQRLRSALAADRSAQMLLLSNSIVMALVLVQQWSLINLLWVYWWQNVIIGFLNWRRIVNLKEFSSSGLKIDGRLVENTPKTRKEVAWFFLAHYGLFHLAYLIFILGINDEKSPEGVMHTAIGLSIFLVNHVFSHYYNRKQDSSGKTNIGAIMFFPYLRVVPMHLVIIAGAWLTQESIWALFIFLLLKSVVDLIMHFVGHRINRVR